MTAIFSPKYRKEPAIYIFTNKLNSKVYVGETTNMQRRMRDYNYPNSRRVFEKALRKYGMNGFHLEIHYMPNFNKDSLLVLEKEIIKRFKSLTTQNGYNICECGTNQTGRLVSEETKIKNRAAAKGNKNMLGKTHNNTTIKKMRDSHSKKSVQQFSNDGIFLNEFISIREAERQTNISNSNIVNCCNNIRKTAGGYIWKYSLK